VVAVSLKKEYVNPILDFCGLIWLTCAYLQLDGNAYWHVAEDEFGIPIEVWPLPSHYVFPMLGESQVIDSYQLRYGQEVTEFPAREIVHFRKPSPLDMVSGLGNLRGVLFAAETNLRMQEWENAVFTNFAMPDFLISPKGDVTEGQTKQFKADWEREYGGWRRRGRMGVAPFEFEIQKLMMTAKDLQFKEGRRAVLEEIAAGFGVPMNILLVDGVTFNNMRHGKQLWVTSTIRPLHKTIVSALNTYMMPRYSGGNGIEEADTLPRRSPWFVALDNPVPEDVDADADRLVKLSGGVPLLDPNEARAELGREPADWGDEPFIPGGVRRPSEPIAGAQLDGVGDGEGDGEPEFKVPELSAAITAAVTTGDTDLANMLRDKLAQVLGSTVPPLTETKPATSGSTGIVDPTDEEMQLGVVDDASGSNGSGTPAEEKEGEEKPGKERPAKSADDGRDGPPGLAGPGTTEVRADEGQEDAARREERERRWEGSELAKALVETVAKGALENETDPDRKDQGFIAKLRGLLAEFGAVVREKVTQLFESTPDLAEMAKQKVLDLLYERDVWVERFADEAMEVTARAFEKGEQLGAVDLSNAGIAFEVSEVLPPDQVEKHVRRLTEHFASTVIQVTGDDVFSAISDGLKAGENVYGISERLAGVYGAKKDSAAERIARTELNRALNAGAQETWKAAGVTQNEWLASVDSCEFCTTLDGKRAAVGQPFVKAGGVVRGADGGTYTAKYGDVLHPTLHPHCTCTIVPVVE
jgi:hypothetical protein